MRRAKPLRSAPDESVITNDLGEFALIDSHTFHELSTGALSATHPRRQDLEARGLLDALGPRGGLADVIKRTRKSFVMEGPSLHIFVVTLRCDHSCQYCQVSRAALNAQGFDMSREHALAALDRVFESDAPTLTIEFQGGEPALRFDLVREIVEDAEARAELLGRNVHFAMTSTLQPLSDDDLAFCRGHSVHLTTSIDGPEALHTGQRSLPTRDSWKRTVEALARARAIVGENGVVALPTITRNALAAPREIVDAYVELGFRALFLRPLAPYGFAAKTQRALGYSTQDFLDFYFSALRYILSLNARGVPLEETTAAIALRHILTPFHSGYMDLRSPAGAGLGVLVYNYDGLVYPSDEARMAAETGDRRFVLGAVSDLLDDLLSSAPMRWLARGAVAENQTHCSECAFVPYCGADPVYHAIAQGEPDAPRHGTPFCERHIALFDWLFGEISRGDPDTMRTFTAWGLGVPREDVLGRWVEQ